MKRNKNRSRSRKSQRLYKMKGCSNSRSRRRKYLGGSPDAPLAYTGTKPVTVPNPFLAYTGKGGNNPNGADKTVPNTGPPMTGGPATPFLNPQTQRGGCGEGMCSAMMKGGGRRAGGCGPLCAVGFMVGGQQHRVGCRCSVCKKRGGGGSQSGGNPGVPYANGSVGKVWTPEVSGWPGVDGVGGNRNMIALNDYKTDVSREMIDSNSTQSGGASDNLLAQDLINLGRQFQYGIGSAYNALAGYASPVNPLPWKGQMPNTPNLNAIKAMNM